MPKPLPSWSSDIQLTSQPPSGNGATLEYCWLLAEVVLTRTSPGPSLMVWPFRYTCSMPASVSAPWPLVTTQRPWASRLKTAPLLALAICAVPGSVSLSGVPLLTAMALPRLMESLPW